MTDSPIHVYQNTPIHFVRKEKSGELKADSLTYKDQAYLYFMREATTYTLSQLATHFGISTGYVSRIVFTWAKLLRIRS